MIRRPPRSTHFPYPTLFQSIAAGTSGEASKLPAATAPSPSTTRYVPNVRSPECAAVPPDASTAVNCRSEEHTSELQSRQYLVCRLLLEKKHQANLMSEEPTS